MLKRNSKSSSAPKSALFLAPLVASMAVLPAIGCLSSSDPGDGESVNITDKSFEAFAASVYKDGTGVWVLNGDEAVPTVRKLKDFYIKYVQKGALIVHQNNGVDAKWDAKQALNLTYCVSQAGFGANYDTVVKAMAASTGAWEGVANVKFNHVVAEDAKCDASNTNVLFDVSSISGQQYLARSFFPGQDRATSNLMIDTTSFGDTGVVTLPGILRHEEGHILGFRHEQTRPEAGTCFEDNNYRVLTDYDSNSVMHYPQCNGTNKGDLILTAKDQTGAALLYGAPGQAPPDPGKPADPGQPTDPGQPAGTCVHDGCVAGEKLDAACDAIAKTVCGTDAYCCASEWDATCVQEAGAAGGSCQAAPADPGGGADTCAHDLCAAGDALDAACSSCAKQVGAADPFCTSKSWDAACVGEAASICNAACK